MSLDEIRRKAKKLQTMARLAALVWIAIGLALFVWFGIAVIRTPFLITRIGWGVLSLWSLYGAYHARWIWPRRLAADATWRASLEFYRGELEKQRDYELHLWRRTGLAWCFIGLALVVVPPLLGALENHRLLLKALPFFVLLSIWFALFFPMRKRKREKLQRAIDEVKLQREIDELNDLSGGNES